MIRCLVFDFDGTLVPSNEIKKRAFFDCVGHLDGVAPFVESLLTTRPTMDRHAVFNAVAEAFPSAGDPLQFADKYGRICESEIVPLLRKSDVPALLDRLKALGVYLYLNSATPWEALGRIAAETDMARSLDGVFGAPQDKADNLKAILAKHALAAVEVAVIGDGESDRAAAQACGCVFLQVASNARDLHGVPADEALRFLAARLPLSGIDDVA